jgi:hypothetical protein
MNQEQFLQHLMRLEDGTIEPEDLAQLEAAMRQDPQWRALFTQTHLQTMALHEALRSESFVGTATPKVLSMPKRVLAWVRRPVAAMSMGLLLGLLGASWVWSAASPHGTSQRMASLINGGFEQSQPEAGFPGQSGLWSGDQAETDDRQAIEGRRSLRFVNTGADATDPTGRAISCDLFQIVDLRPLKDHLSEDSQALLELSASFLDARASGSHPSVTFTAQLFLFSGDPAQAKDRWPAMGRDALASGAAFFTSLGGANWKQATARCLLPPQADYAVIQIAARPDVRPTKLQHLHADDVRLTLKTQPALPLRVASR